jgi:hypothetical protein
MPSYKEMKITPPPGVSENDPVPGSYRGVPPSAKTSSVETPYAPFAKQTTTTRRSTPNLPSPPAEFQSGRTETSPLPVSAVDPRRAQALATGTGGFHTEPGGFQVWDKSPFNAPSTRLPKHHSFPAASQWTRSTGRIISN